MFNSPEDNPKKCSVKAQSLVKPYKREFENNNYCNLYYIMNNTRFVSGKVEGGFIGKPDKEDYEDIENKCKM